MLSIMPAVQKEPSGSTLSKKFKSSVDQLAELPGNCNGGGCCCEYCGGGDGCNCGDDDGDDDDDTALVVSVVVVVVSDDADDVLVVVVIGGAVLLLLLLLLLMELDDDDDDDDCVICGKDKSGCRVENGAALLKEVVSTLDLSITMGAVKGSSGVRD
jgi:hypothetical protein